MPNRLSVQIYSIIISFIFGSMIYSAAGYNNFTTAVYARVYEVIKMGEDAQYLEKNFDEISKHLHVDKIYLETHRDMIVAEQETITKLKEYFADKGVKTSGGITITVNERNRFETYCYSNPEHRKKLKEVVEFTALNFDELILDDFFFTSCKCELCIQAKGSMNWTEFRLQLLTDAARDLVIEPARKVNQNISVIIKYPNWYEHFQGLGFNLEDEPKMFDKIYTGTETRDAVQSNQHLQEYHGYLIFRYFENIKPGGNAGGWVDTGGLKSLDRYAEQLWLTLFAKAPEMTMFDYRQLIRPIKKEFRAEWQGQQTSFDFDEMITPYLQADGTWPKETMMVLAAGYSLKKIDLILGEIGNPIGIKSYKPYHSTGEDFIHTYLGMIGIPMDLVPEFPQDADVVFLAESAKFDAEIIKKMKKQLLAGKDVVITSGLLRALQGKGIEDIVELRYTDRKSNVTEFTTGYGQTHHSEKSILIPQIQYLTNDSWENISARDGELGWPIVHQAGYANGNLFVLTIPDNFADLYNLPVEVASGIKKMMTKEMYVRLEGANKISLFVYDNNTFIIESFLDNEEAISLIVDNKIKNIKDISTGEILSGIDIIDWRGEKTDESSYKTIIKPHSYRVFHLE